LSTTSIADPADLAGANVDAANASAPRLDTISRFIADRFNALSGKPFKDEFQAWRADFKPGIQAQDWSTRELRVYDPFNNQITFGEPIRKRR